jgi:hypothetical protein
MTSNIEKCFTGVQKKEEYEHEIEAYEKINGLDCFVKLSQQDDKNLKITLEKAVVCTQKTPPTKSQFIKFLKTYEKCYKDFGFRHGDLSIDNFGILNNNLVLFDLGEAYWDKPKVPNSNRTLQGVFLDDRDEVVSLGRCLHNWGFNKEDIQELLKNVSLAKK